MAMRMDATQFKLYSEAHRFAFSTPLFTSTSWYEYEITHNTARRDRDAIKRSRDRYALALRAVGALRVSLIEHLHNPFHASAPLFSLHLSTNADHPRT